MSLLRPRIIAFASAPLVLALAAFASLGGIAFAHGHTTVGNYNMVIGFANEPAYAGEPNGLELRVSDNTSDQPVVGLEQTLQVEIINGSHRQTLPVKAMWGEEGSYTASVLPTREGDYTWHIYGDIQGTPVDVSMTSSPTTFNSVQSKAAISFPFAEPSPTELAAQVASANRMTTVALALGAIGVLAGALGVFFGLRKSAAARDARSALSNSRAKA